MKKFFILVFSVLLASCVSFSPVSNPDKPKTIIQHAMVLPVCAVVDTSLVDRALETKGSKVWSIDTQDRGGIVHYRRVIAVGGFYYFVYFINTKDIEYINLHRKFRALGGCKSGNNFYEISVETKQEPVNKQEKSSEAILHI